MARIRPFDQVWTPFYQGEIPAEFQPHGSCRIEILGWHKEPDLRAHCAIPEDAYCYRLTVNDPLGECRYQVSFFGYEEDRVNPLTAAPHCTLSGQPNNLVLVAVQRCVRHTKTALWLEALLVLDMRVKIDMHGLEHPHANDEVTLMRHGLVLLHQLDLGRKPETSRLYTYSEFHEVYPKAVATAQRWRRKDPVRQEDIARMCRPFAPASFRRYAFLILSSPVERLSSL